MLILDNFCSISSRTNTGERNAAGDKEEATANLLLISAVISGKSWHDESIHKLFVTVS